MKLFSEIKNEDDLNVFQNEIHVFNIWCCKSLLELNVKKCNLITYSRKLNNPGICITLGNQNVKQCDRIRDLGVILDSKLTFVDHYNTIIHRAGNMLNFIKRFGFHFKDPYTIKSLYVSYVRSILEYCSVVWSPYMKVHEDRIESIQKQFLLYALRKLGWTVFPLPSYEARCLLINIQTLKERRDHAKVFYVNNIVSQHTDSSYILSRLNLYAPSRQLRNRHLFAIHRHCTNDAKFGPVKSDDDCL